MCSFKIEGPPWGGALRWSNIGEPLLRVAFARVCNDVANRGHMRRVDCAVRQRGKSDLVFEDQHGAAEANDNDIERKQDAQPEMHLKERPAQPEFSWMVKDGIKHQQFHDNEQAAWT